MLVIYFPAPSVRMHAPQALVFVHAPQALVFMHAPQARVFVAPQSLADEQATLNYLLLENGGRLLLEDDGALAFE